MVFRLLIANRVFCNQVVSFNSCCRNFSTQTTFNHAKLLHVFRSQGSRCTKTFHGKNIWWSRSRNTGSKAEKKRSIVYTPVLLSLGSPFAFFQRQKDQVSAQVLAHIPKEVFRSDVKPNRKQHGFIKRQVVSLWRLVRYVLRFSRLVVTFTPILCLYPITYLGSAMQRRWWRLLLFACELSGPTFIKLGQWASTRRDLFSAEFCDMFAKLHNCTKIHSWYITKYKLRQVFGKYWNEVFVYVEKKPMGSGCVAQVHKAWMKSDMVPDVSLVEEVLAGHDDDDTSVEIDFAEGMEITGVAFALDTKDTVKNFVQEKVLGSKPAGPPVPTSLPASEKDNSDSPLSQTPSDRRETVEGATLIPVAIKVVHPGVFKEVRRDLNILQFVSRFIEFLIPSIKWLSVSECCEEFTQLLMRQIDLRYEASCLDKFTQNFEDDPNVRFPRPIWPYCKRDILVETYEEGEPMSDFLRENAAVPDGLKELLAGYGVQALLQMVFVDNFVHGDLHPGNILVQNADSYNPQDESKLVLVDICDTVVVNVKPVENPVRIVLLDAGITSSLSNSDMNNFKSVFTAVVIGEGEKVAELMLRHARYNECKDIGLFKKELEHLVTTTRQQTISLGKVQVAELLSGVFSIMSRHKVKLESNFASVLLAIFVLEGLGRSLDPDLDILAKAKPILLAH